MRSPNPLLWLWRRPTLLIMLILAIWIPFKIVWEVRMQEEFERLRFKGLEISRNLRDQLSQNAMLGLLGGMRGIVANLISLEVTDAWTEKDWTRVKKNVLLSTTIQPRFVPFWDIGGWHLAWNASVDSRYDPKETQELQRRDNERYWIEQGRQIFHRGAQANPETYQLWARLADLYDQKLKDHRKAAEYYLKASEYPDAPLFYERFPAYMWDKAGEDQLAYQHWKKLWEKHLDSPDSPQIAKYKIETEIRRLEEKLGVSPEKRVFPTDKTSPNLQDR